MSKLISGNHKCREVWPSLDYEKAYNLFLDFVLLVIPLLTLAVTYSLITQTLFRGMRTEKAFQDKNGTFFILLLTVLLPKSNKLYKNYNK